VSSSRGWCRWDQFAGVVPESCETGRIPGADLPKGQLVSLSGRREPRVCRQFRKSNPSRNIGMGREKVVPTWTNESEAADN